MNVWVQETKAGFKPPIMEVGCDRTFHWATVCEIMRLHWSSPAVKRTWQSGLCVDGKRGRIDTHAPFTSLDGSLAQDLWSQGCWFTSLSWKSDFTTESLSKALDPKLLQELIDPAFFAHPFFWPSSDFSVSPLGPSDSPGTSDTTVWCKDVHLETAL